jgi:hypothetical protein
VVGLVEPLTLGAIAAALAARALTRAEDRVVEGGESALRRVFDALKRRFSEAEEEAGSSALERLEDAPDSPQRIRELAQLLDERADAVPGLRRELEALVEDVRGAGIDVDSVSQTALGDQNVQAAGMVNSEVNVTFAAQPGERRSPRDPD